MSTTDLQAYRGSLLHFLADPAFSDQSYQWCEDGLLIVADGKVQAAGDYATLHAALPAGATVHDYSGMLLMPGLSTRMSTIRRPT
jgi:guanine deaminase